MQEQGKERWLALWERIHARGNGYPVYRDLLERYAEPHRFYHKLPHVLHCLGEFGRAFRLTSSPDALEFALWFHDAVYDPKAKDNEEQSVALALSVARTASLPNGFGEKVAVLILATKHTEVLAEPNTQLIADIDLTVLAQSDRTFDQYEREIRLEYAWVPDEQFAEGRSAILQLFLARPTVYQTKFFRELYEEQARRNIRRSLQRLSSSP